MPNHILITGGTGLIGSRLTEILREKGYDIAHLSRRRKGDENVKTYVWDIGKGSLEPESIEKAKAVVHLAGANLSTKRWTESRKKLLVKSRTETSDLLYKNLKSLKHQVKCVVSASGANYYGADTGDRIMNEEAPAGKDFLGDLCLKWEQGVRRIEELGVRTVQLRTGAALSLMGGFLGPVLPLVKAGLASPIGTGQQFLSWIHIDDLCLMYIKAIEDESMAGAFNAAAPRPERNKDFMRRLAKAVRRPFFFPHAPGFAVKLFFGEMAGLVLGGVRTSSEKIEGAGFKFNYPDLGKALKNLFGKV